MEGDLTVAENIPSFTSSRSHEGEECKHSTEDKRYPRKPIFSGLQKDSGCMSSHCESVQSASRDEKIRSSRRPCAGEKGRIND